MSKKKYSVGKHARRGGGHQKAGSKDPKLVANRQASEAVGTSRYAVPARAGATAISNLGHVAPGPDSKCNKP